MKAMTAALLMGLTSLHACVESDDTGTAQQAEIIEVHGCRLVLQEARDHQVAPVAMAEGEAEAVGTRAASRWIRSPTTTRIGSPATTGVLGAGASARSGAGRSTPTCSVIGTSGACASRIVARTTPILASVASHARLTATVDSRSGLS
jgi:hypothetical protein